MGGGISLSLCVSLSNHLIHDSSLDSSFDSLLPRYFSHKLYQSDLDVCSKCWESILMDTASGYTESKWAQSKYSSCGAWLDQLLFQQFQSLPVPLPTKILEDFLSSMRAIININFRSDTTFQKNLIRILCQQSLATNHIQTCHFFQYGIALFSGLRIVTGGQFLGSIEKSWQRLYSFVLSVCVPIAEEYQSRLYGENQVYCFTAIDLTKGCARITEETSNLTSDQVDPQQPDSI
jgi:hypothetical protein